MARLRKIPVHRTVPALARDPLRAFAQIGRECDGALARLHLGLTRPYLATHPDHVQQILRAPERYRREGMLWRPLRRLEGNGIAGEGPGWRASRQILQPQFTAHQIAARQAAMAAAVTDALDRLAARARDRPGQPLDLTTEMTSLMHRVLVRVLLRDQLPAADADRLGAAIETAFQRLGWRMLLPFVPDAVPLPGDRAFGRAVATVDGLVYPHIRARRRGAGAADEPAGGDPAADDLVGWLSRATDEAGLRWDDQRVRDDVVAMFVAGTETTALALTWLWLLVDAHPEVAARLTEEIDRVVGDRDPAPEHLPRLAYTRAVLQEVLRLYPIGWVIPRTVAEPDTIDGVLLPAGATVLLSPYLTHRLPGFWEAPEEFRPDRFAAGAGRPHRFAYFPFGAGVHQCLGSHFFLAEGQLAVAGLLRRFRLAVVGAPSLRPRATASLRPRARAGLLLRPR